MNNAMAYLISEYWFDSSENRDFEGYTSKFITLNKKDAEVMVKKGGMVPGETKLIYPLLPEKPIENILGFEMGGYQGYDYNATPTIEREMHPRFIIQEIPLL
jgi:hypothetical protein